MSSSASTPVPEARGAQHDTHVKRLGSIRTGVLVATLLLSGRAAFGDRAQVGRQTDGAIVVPTNQLLRPTGSSFDSTCSEKR